MARNMNYRMVGDYCVFEFDEEKPNQKASNVAVSNVITNYCDEDRIQWTETDVSVLAKLYPVWFEGHSGKPYRNSAPSVL